MKDTIVLVDTERKVQINSYLVDKDNTEINLQEFTGKIIRYLEKELSNPDSNVVKNQTLPLLSTSLGHYLLSQLSDMTPLITGNPGVMHLLTRSLALGFYIYHLMKQKELKVKVAETEISNAEIKRLREIHALLEMGALCKLTGVSPEEFMKNS